VWPDIATENVEGLSDMPFPDRDRSAKKGAQVSHSIVLRRQHERRGQAIDMGVNGPPLIAVQLVSTRDGADVVGVQQCQAPRQGAAEINASPIAQVSATSTTALTSARWHLSASVMAENSWNGWVRPRVIVFGGNVPGQTEEQPDRIAPDDVIEQPPSDSRMQTFPLRRRSPGRPKSRMALIAAVKTL